MSSVRFFERGVGETQSSGTGSCASAVAAMATDSRFARESPRSGRHADRPKGRSRSFFFADQRVWFVRENFCFLKPAFTVQRRIHACLKSKRDQTAGPSARRYHRHRGARQQSQPEADLDAGCDALRQARLQTVLFRFDSRTRSLLCRIARSTRSRTGRYVRRATMSEPFFARAVDMARTTCSMA